MKALAATLTCLLAFGCAPYLTPLQEAGYKAFEECKREGSYEAWIESVGTDGSMRWGGHLGHASGMNECLKKKGWQ